MMLNRLVALLVGLTLMLSAGTLYFNLAAIPMVAAVLIGLIGLGLFLYGGGSWILELLN